MLDLNVFSGFGSGSGNIFLVSFAGDTQDQVLHTILQASPHDWDGIGAVTVTVTVESGARIGSTSPSNAALTITGFPSGSNIKLINNGKILGKGGLAGDGAGNNPGNPGASGSTALQVDQLVTIDNPAPGIIGGGGGGGGAGGGNNCSVGMESPCSRTYSGAGGGGGAGFDVGLHGTPQGTPSGADGSEQFGGAGGGGGVRNTGCCSATVGGGGTGGNLGLAGDNGSSSTQPHAGGAGGAASNAIDLSGTGSIVFITEGDIRGAVS